MLDISFEIWKEIACYLPLTDKATASRVNKAWNNIFRPHLYRSLSLRNGDNNRDDDKSLEGENDEDEEEEEENDDRADRARRILEGVNASQGSGLRIRGLHPGFEAGFPQSVPGLSHHLGNKEPQATVSGRLANCRADSKSIGGFGPTLDQQPRSQAC